MMSTRCLWRLMDSEVGGLLPVQGGHAALAPAGGQHLLRQVGEGGEEEGLTPVRVDVTGGGQDV